MRYVGSLDALERSEGGFKPVYGLGPRRHRDCMSVPTLQDRELNTFIAHGFSRYDLVPEKGTRGVAKVMSHLAKEIEVWYFMRQQTGGSRLDQERGEVL
jgi:hypothetical protein